jgi:predicted AlkP superfamily phosphohydrolase/phosphomutase
LRETGNPIARFVDRTLRLRISQAVERVLEPGPRLRHPLDCSAFGYMPQLWYQPFWRSMKAFALPSFSEGNVRLNVAGREAEGLVAPDDFVRVGDEIVALLRGLTDPRTGRPIIREILRTRSAPHGNPKGPDADIIVLWQPEPTDVVDTAAHGRIGPVPFRRTGDHHNVGFFAVTGPGLPHAELPDGALADLAPTILDLMGVPVPNHFDGRSRVPALMQQS